MDKKNINKAVTFSFAAIAVLVWWVAGVILETLAAGVASVGRLKAFNLAGIGIYDVLLPVLIGFLAFLYLQLNAKRKAWAEDVVLETSKVVWPPLKDVQVSTVVVSIMLIISGVVLFGMDALASSVIDFILGR